MPCPVGNLFWHRLVSGAFWEQLSRIYEIMKNGRLLLVISACILLLSCSEKPLSTLVETDAGTIEGTIENGIKVFKGVPFAAPPVGDLRWKAPQPVVPWDGVRKTDKFGPACPQPQNLPQSEDCLYLNIWTPANYASEKLPVMVWIHGGGFSMGAPLESTYFGEKLTREGVIYISVAYRLGVLGFLAHPELTAESPDKVSGNYGLLDMIAALQWVNRNISAFGGDPQKVTIFGESAGGAAVSILCASPLTKDLFRGAICQSGGNFSPVDSGSLLIGAEKSGIEFMKRMGANNIEEMRAMPPEDFFKDRAGGRYGFRPNVDGFVLTGDQYKLYESGKYNHIDVMIGLNSDEGGLFVRQTPEPDAYNKSITDRFGPYADRFMAAYPGETKEERYYSSADLTRDSGFGWATWTWARLQSRTSETRVFTYYFDQKQPEMPNMPVKLRGAPHAAEIKYVFRNLNENRFSEEDFKLSEMMAKYWTNFAKNGDPNGGDLPLWPQFKEEEPVFMYLKGTPTSGPVPNLDKLRLFEEYYSFVRSGN